MAPPPTPGEEADQLGSAVPQFGPRNAFASEAEDKTPSEPAPRGSFAMARIHGRAVGGEASRGKLEIKVEDSTRAYEAQINDDGTFEINLPAGNYAMMASSGKKVALAEVAGLAENEDREVVLVLAEGVSIEGRIEGCEGMCEGVSVRAQVLGPQLMAATSESGDHGEFEVDGLVPGRTYDLTFAAEGMRRLVLRAIPAPKRGLVVTLEPAAKLSGGFGLEPGKKCPMESVSVDTLGDAPELVERFDRACQFHIEDLPDAESVHVQATGKGWHFELDVALPAHGNPPFLCLHPTCRDPEPEPEAALEVTIVGGEGRDFYLSATTADGEDRVRTGCHGSSGPCVFEKLRPGRAEVEVHSSRCEERTFTLELHAGRNYLTSPCEVLRPIQGAIKGAEETAGARVRCSSDRPARPTHGFLFTLECPERQSTIEYQLAENGPWMVAAISPGSANSIGFVDIDAG